MYQPRKRETLISHELRHLKLFLAETTMILSNTVHAVRCTLLSLAHDVCLCFIELLHRKCQFSLRLDMDCALVLINEAEVLLTLHSRTHLCTPGHICVYLSVQQCVCRPLLQESNICVQSTVLPLHSNQSTLHNNRVKLNCFATVAGALSAHPHPQLSPECWGVVWRTIRGATENGAKFLRVQIAEWYRVLM